MNKLILVVAFILSSTVIFGQAQIGIRFFQGFQLQSQESKFLVGQENRVEYRINLESVSNSQTVGIFSQLNFGFLYLQGEVLYTKYSTNYMVEEFNTDNRLMTTFTEQFQQIDVPINSGIKYKNFRFGVGPIFHFGQEINSDLTKLNNITIATKHINCGFQGSIGYDINIFHFDVRYQNDFNSFTDHVYFSNNIINMKSTPSSIQVGVAVALEKK